ncbi:MAG: NADP-specific glutamate dehydrogenase [Eubacteriales bacterium]|nr:NADP-specific glutamate dehydrogenase [Eubacteriales bacterium]
MNKYIERVIADVKAKNPTETEFIQTVEEVLSTLSPIIDAHPEYEKAALLEKMVEPERTIMFRVPWTDDKGVNHVNRGYRVQFNGAIGPYKGGLRFAPHVTLSVMKFLGFEQTLKNSLTTLPMGGAKGGSDFDPNGKSDEEIKRFCQSFMTELYRHIGPNLDVPAGDIGVGGREIGYLFGQYRRIRGNYENGVLTGKGRSFGGSKIRPEATGYGAIYFLNAILKHEGDTVKGKTVTVSGYGNVAWGVCKKLAQEGAKVVTLSGSDGYIYDEEGINTEEKLNYLLEMRLAEHNTIKAYADKFGVPFFPGERPWGVKADIAMPCAVQNEVDIEDAKKIVANGTKYYIEVSNMPTTPEAFEYLRSQEGVIIAPSKAANAGGVLVSGLEMSQNSERLSWSSKEVDEKLESIMTKMHDKAAAAAEKYGLGYDLVSGANMVGFKKVADAMMEQGI